MFYILYSASRRVELDISYNHRFKDSVVIHAAYEWVYEDVAQEI